MPASNENNGKYLYATTFNDPPSERNLKRGIIKYLYATTFNDPPFEVPLRSEPKVTSYEIYKCPKDAIVYVIDNKRDVFYKVKVDGFKGYISKNFLMRKE